MSGDREAILGRIREALRVPAPRHHEKPAIGAAKNVTAQFREWLPAVGESIEERVACFARLSEMLKTEFIECRDAKAAAAHITKLAAEGDWKKLARHSGTISDAVAAHLPPQLSRMSTDVPYDKNELEKCDAGISECECLVAQTGSVCVTTHSSGGRALSVLPPHHVVVASRRQLVTDLSEAYELLARQYASGYPSFISFITGPSRTGDIERILVLGAHGPKKLTVLLLP